MTLDANFRQPREMATTVSDGLDPNLYQGKSASYRFEQLNETRDSLRLDLDWPPKLEFFCKGDAPGETPEQRTDQKIKDTFGADVIEHLKDADWLIDNRKKLEDGFKKAKGQDAYDMACRMRDLSVVDGKSLIYLSKVESRSSGNLIPKRFDVYLRRGSLRSDNYVGHVYK